MFLFSRDDCITLLRDCSNSTFSPEAVCDIIAPASSNTHCVNISDYLCKGTALVQLDSTLPPFILSVNKACLRTAATYLVFKLLRFP